VIVESFTFGGKSEEHEISSRQLVDDSLRVEFYLIKKTSEFRDYMKALRSRVKKAIKEELAAIQKSFESATDDEDEDDK